MSQALVANPLSDHLAKLKAAANGVVAAVVRLLFCLELHGSNSLTQLEPWD